MRPAFSRLDERLGLRPGSTLTPWLVEGLVWLGASLPFGQVPAILRHFTGVTVSAETVRRLTEAAGAAQVAVETEAVTRLERTLPEPPPGPPVQLLSVDGAMVPLNGGAWAEVKTGAIGEVVATPDSPRTRTLSYFSRLADTDTFGRLATIETHRRGTSTAGTVVAVSDGAVWCQGFVDLHRPDAVRILDFPHALGHLGQVAQAHFGPGTETASGWLGTWTHALRHGREDAVLAELTRLGDAPTSPPEAREIARQAWGYLATRRAQIRYQAFTALGYPIGSGCVESANKLVMEARLKGAGRGTLWVRARANVNPMLVLRTALANDRWDATWAELWPRLRRPPRPPRADPHRPPPEAPPPAA